jgi:hypothetical protein
MRTTSEHTPTEGDKTSVELRLIRASEFLRLDAHKHLNVEATKEALKTLAQACRKRGLESAMVDLRNLPMLAKPHFSGADLAALVGAFREAGFTRQHRLAIVYRHDVYTIIRNFAFMSRMKGLQVQAFSEYESALQWLSHPATAGAETAAAEFPVPINKSKTGTKKLPVEITTASLLGHRHRGTRRNRISGHNH